MTPVQTDTPVNERMGICPYLRLKQSKQISRTAVYIKFKSEFLSSKVHMPMSNTPLVFYGVIGTRIWIFRTTIRIKLKDSGLKT